MSKRPTIRKTLATKGTPHQTSLPANGYEYGNPARAQMRSELIPREKPATTMKATALEMAALLSAKGCPFGILVIEPRRQISLSIQRDIHHMKFLHTSLHRVQSLAEARTLLAKEPIEVVIMNLNFPSDALTDFFRDYPAHRRPFALILTETLEQSVITMQTTVYRHHLRSTNLVATEQASGYLLLGASSNDDLRESLERARQWVQERFMREYQNKVITSLEDYFKHPVIAARQRLANTRAEGELNSFYAMSGECLRYKTMRTEQILPFDKIVYLRGDDKYLTIRHFTDTNDIKTLTLHKREVFPQLPLFIINVHASYWVNVAYIRELNDTEVVLLTNDRIPIARRERKALENALHQMHPESFAIPILKNVLTRSTRQRTRLEYAIELFSEGDNGGGGEIVLEFTKVQM